MSASFLIVLCAACGGVLGAFAGVWGIFPGLCAGIFASLIARRLKEEKAWKREVEQGTSSEVKDEPFYGALYVCALAVFCLGDSRGASSLMHQVFPAYHADWASMCRACASANSLNSDLLVECLAHRIKRQQTKSGYSPELLKNIFALLGAAEFSWNETRQGERPSRYLAELLDYTYVSDELASAYRTLGLTADASLAKVKTAHRSLAARYHPDNADSADSAAFLRIQKAYEVILCQQS